MGKRITPSQHLGELGEASIKKLALEMGFIYEQRGRLEAGIDGIIELRDPVSGKPLGRLLGVQVKATASGRYIRETEGSFEYSMRRDDLDYWRLTNIPVIIVLWRQSDNSAYWKHVTGPPSASEQRLHFDKNKDKFDHQAGDLLGALTIDRRTPGLFVPPLNHGESALVNLLRIILPAEIFIATSPFGSGRDAIPELIKQERQRYDWVIRKKRFVSFFDPRGFGTRAIVDPDQVEAIETPQFTLNDDLDDTNDTIELLRRSVERQTARELAYSRAERLFYFHASASNRSRSYRYAAAIKETSAKVVSASPGSRSDRDGFVRHHAATCRFERLGDEWFVVVDPTFFFTRNGFVPHPHAEALLAGKKRLERNAAVRGQVIMWQHLLKASSSPNRTLFENESESPTLQFESLPMLQLERAVPESSWTRTDPNAKDMESADLFELGLDR